MIAPYVHRALNFIERAAGLGSYLGPSQNAPAHYLAAMLEHYRLRREMVRRQDRMAAEGITLRDLADTDPRREDF